MVGPSLLEMGVSRMPAERSSIPTTTWPSRTSRSAKLLPTNPATPVISTVCFAFFKMGFLLLASDLKPKPGGEPHGDDSTATLKIENGSHGAEQDSEVD